MITHQYNMKRRKRNGLYHEEQVRLLCTNTYWDVGAVSAVTAPLRVTCYDCLTKLLPKYELIVSQLKIARSVAEQTPAEDSRQTAMEIPF